MHYKLRVSHQLGSLKRQLPFSYEYLYCRQPKKTIVQNMCNCIAKFRKGGREKTRYYTYGAKFFEANPAVLILVGEQYRFVDNLLQLRVLQIVAYHHF